MKRWLGLLMALVMACSGVIGGLAEGVEPEAAELSPEALALELDEIELPELDEAPAIEALPELTVDAIDADIDLAGDADAPEANEGEADEASEGVAIDENNFPDAGFRAYVQAHFDTDGDKALSPAEIKAVTKIDLEDEEDLEWESLKGIEFFTALKVLVFIDLEVSTLDVSANTALTSLECYEINLKTLVLGDKPALKKLDCSDNGLTALDLSKCPKLKELDCSENKLTALDLSKCPELTDVDCQENKLTALNVSKCAKLKELYCADNKLTQLDVTACAALKVLDCDKNGLTKLNVSKCANLKDLCCSGNKLTALNLKQNKALDVLYCDGNQIAKLDLTNNPKLISYINKVEPAYEKQGIYWEYNNRYRVLISKTTRLETKDRYLYPFRSAKKLNVTLKKTEVKGITVAVTDKGTVTRSVANAKTAKCAVGKYSGDKLAVTFTGLAAGTTKVKLVHKATKQAVTVTVKVAKTTEPTSISFKQGTEKTIRSWQTLKLTPVFKPAKAYSRVTWKCSDKSLVVVDQDGNVYPKNSKNGTVTITATTANGKSAQFKLTLHSTMAHAARLEEFIGKSVTTMKKKLTMPMYPKNGEFIHEVSGNYPVKLRAGVSAKGKITYFDVTGHYGSITLFTLYTGMGTSLAHSQLSKKGWTYSSTSNGMEVYTKSGNKYKLKVAFSNGVVSRMYYGS